MESEADLDGYLAAFGTAVRCKGFELRGILDNDAEETQLRSVRISGNAPLIHLKPSDIERIALAYNDAMTVTTPAGDVNYLARDQQPDGLGGLTVVRLVEAS